MKKIWGLVREHVRNDFNGPCYLCIALFLAANIAVNYLWIGWESKIDRDMTKSARIFQYFMLYGFAWYGGFLITGFFNKKLGLFRNGRFWLLTLTGLMILSFDSGFPYMTKIMSWIEFDVHLYTWVYAIAGNFQGVLIVGILLFLVYQFMPVSRGDGLGLDPPRHHIKPYLVLLMIAVPVITIASFQRDFINYYPTFRGSSVAQILGISGWIPVAIYEISYGLDFIDVELLFRGFMVIGLSQLLGKEAILPMVTTYCFLHFGKPLGETISSIFGGYVLGILAFYTRSIWGGIIIHIGIAWLMELAAYLQKVPG